MNSTSQTLASVQKFSETLTQMEQQEPPKNEEDKDDPKASAEKATNESPPVMALGNRMGEVESRIGGVESRMSGIELALQKIEGVVLKPSAAAVASPTSPA